MNIYVYSYKYILVKVINKKRTTNLKEHKGVMGGLEGRRGMGNDVIII